MADGGRARARAGGARSSGSATAPIWIGGSPAADLELAESMLAATERIAVATGIVNMWTTPAEAVAESYHRIEGRYPGRFLLGVGIGHPEATSEYRSPFATIVEYLDRLDAAEVPIDGAGAGRARAEGAAGGRRADRGRAPLPDHPGAHPARPASCSAPTCCWPRSTSSSWTRTRSGPARSAGRPCSATSACATTPRTCGGWASPTTTWPARAATGWSTRWWRTATRRRWRPGSPSTWTPAPTTCACRCSATATRCRRCARWPRRWPCAVTRPGRGSACAAVRAGAAAGR